MTRVVIDTNVLVSALLSPYGNPARVIDLIMNGLSTVCYDSRILSEYREVLQRPKFGFENNAGKQIIDFICRKGLSIVPEPVMTVFEDEDDKTFYEVAKTANAFLVTGNIKHFPEESLVVTPTVFLKTCF